MAQGLFPLIVRFIIGYLLWFFLGGLGAHRFFLGRVASGFLMLLLTLVLITLIVLAALPLFNAISQAENPEPISDANLLAQLEASPLMLPAGMLSLVLGLWWLFDLVLVAIIVLKDAEAAEEADRQTSSINVQAVNMDPSFQSAMGTSGTDDTRPRRSALPDDYVMPWRQPDPRGTQKIYKPDED
ncbi:MAG: TM2 domain-containing protein [Paracoccaceae bacterium]